MTLSNWHVLCGTETFLRDYFLSSVQKIRSSESKQYWWKPSTLQPAEIRAVCDPLLLLVCTAVPPAYLSLVACCQVNTGTIHKKMKQYFGLPSSASLSKCKHSKQKFTSS